MTIPLPMFKNSQGQPDFLMSAAVLTVGTVLLKVVLGGAVILGHQLGPAPDAALVGALLVPTLGAYTAKRIGVQP